MTTATARRRQVLLRSRDVLLALSAAGAYGQTLGKIQLQKFIYLMDALGFLYSVMPPPDGHKTYKHGPWDLGIQVAVDALVFRGHVDAVTTHLLVGGIAAEYRTTKAGAVLAAALSARNELHARSLLSLEIARHVNRLGWNRLKQLVYAEPTFLRQRGLGFGVALKPGERLDDSTRALSILIGRALAWEGSLPGRQTVVDVFFRFLEACVSPDGERSSWI